MKNIMKNLFLIIAILSAIITIVGITSQDFVSRLAETEIVVRANIEEDVKAFTMTARTERAVSKYNNMVNTVRKLWWLEVDEKDFEYIYYDVDCFK